MYCQLGFSSKIEVPQLGSTRLGTLHSSALLELEKSSSNSSLLYTFRVNNSRNIIFEMFTLNVTDISLILGQLFLLMMS